MLKGYRYRIYPNKGQEILIGKTFGCTRFVYNKMLEHKKKVYEEEKRTLSKYDCTKYCNNELKKEYEWLKEVDKFSLENSIFNMCNAFEHFFNDGAGYPKFKRKHDSYKSYKTNMTNNNIAVDFENGRIKLPKLGRVRAKFHRRFEGKIKSATISQVPSGKYYVSILVDVSDYEQMPPSDHNVGLDLGLKDECITSDGKKYENIKVSKKYEKKLAREQRWLSRKQFGSKNYEKQRRQVALCHEKIRNVRRDHLHKISHEIVQDNQLIVSEDLAVSNMVKNHKLSGAIYDVSWSELTRQIDYKAKWNGRIYIKVDRFFPSSQLCSVCGYQYVDMKDLSVRSWKCPNCGTVHDRDVNASCNILQEGLAMLKKGDSIR